MRMDLNCDLGEGEPPARTRALMRWITSANVACGGHAGSVATMETCVRLAKDHGVRLGAHPGPWSRRDFGRGSVLLSPGDLELLLLQQVGALEQIARAGRIRLHHVKLHGALYHASEADPRLARRYLEVMKVRWPGCVVYARAAGTVAREGRRAGIDVWGEAFADRGYRDDGTLVGREEPGALLTRTTDVMARLRSMRERGELETVSGRRLAIRARTICVHSDTRNAVRLAKALAQEMRGRPRGDGAGV